MRDAMRADLTAALRVRDWVAVAALRTALAAFDNAEAVSPGDRPGVTETERRLLTETDLRSIVTDEIGERSVAAAQYEQAGRSDHAQRLRAEADLLRHYLA